MNRHRYDEPALFSDGPEKMSPARRVAAALSMVAILAVCLFCAVQMGGLAPTYDGSLDVAALEKDPDAYSLENADGAAYVIVAKNLAETAAKNVCFSVVFNFRGYDTMGESFILIAALAGSLCILRSPKKAGAQKPEEEKEAAQDGE